MTPLYVRSRKDSKILLILVLHLSCLTSPGHMINMCYITWYGLDQCNMWTLIIVPQLSVVATSCWRITFCTLLWTNQPTNNVIMTGVCSITTNTIPTCDNHYTINQTAHQTSQWMNTPLKDQLQASTLLNLVQIEVVSW